MSFRRENSNFDQWRNYCNEKQNLISELNLNSWIFKTEQNFRDFVTFGKADENGMILDFDSLEDDKCLKLLHFIEDFHFDMDTILFKCFNKSLGKRKNISNDDR